MLERMSCMEASGLSSSPRVRPALAKRLPSPFSGTCLKLKPPKTPPHNNCKLKSQIRRSPVCLMGGKDRAQDEGAAWKAFGKAVEKFSNGQSIEDVLRHQMENKEYYVCKNPPRGGGGGSGGGGGNGRDGSGGSGDKGFRNEAKQVILATAGFLLLYIYFISGQELTCLGRDYIRYLSGGPKSVRLKNAMYSWERFWMGLGEKVYDKKWLEKLVANTQSWYNSPEKYRCILGSRMASKSDDE